MDNNQQLIFIYNAKSGFMHGVMDLMHKTASPKTYPCKLCQITYAGATMNKFWKRYVASLGIPAVFMHKDEFAKTYPKVNITFPASAKPRSEPPLSIRVHASSTESLVVTFETK